MSYHGTATHEFHIGFGIMLCHEFVWKLPIVKRSYALSASIVPDTHVHHVHTIYPVCSNCGVCVIALQNTFVGYVPVENNIPILSLM